VAAPGRGDRIVCLYESEEEHRFLVLSLIFPGPIDHPLKLFCVRIDFRPYAGTQFIHCNTNLLILFIITTFILTITILFNTQDDHIVLP